MKLIVGLGNPGKDYENTRHNVGFLFIDNFLKKKALKTKKKFNSLYAEYNIDNEKIILLKPQTYMNLSGIAVKKYVDYFNIKIEDILIIYDDMDFETGTFKIKPTGSSGGHNGIKNILDNLGTQNIKRIRIGISKTKNDKIDYVIGKFRKEEKEQITNIIEISDKIIEDFINLSFSDFMNKYN